MNGPEIIAYFPGHNGRAIPRADGRYVIDSVPGEVLNFRDVVEVEQDPTCEGRKRAIRVVERTFKYAATITYVGAESNWSDSTVRGEAWSKIVTAKIPYESSGVLAVESLSPEIANASTSDLNLLFAMLENARKLGLYRFGIVTSGTALLPVGEQIDWTTNDAGIARIWT